MDDFRAVGERLSNWGRWGADDERGTTNLITPERLVAAARLVRTGKVFDLGIPFDELGPQTGGGIRQNPLHFMTATGDAQDHMPGGFRYADDYVVMPLQCATQWDALSHVFYDDQLYNGYPASDVTPRGALHNSIDKQGNGITGRGVLLDIAALKDVPWLEGGTVITPDDLDARDRTPGWRRRRARRRVAVPHRMAPLLRRARRPRRVARVRARARPRVLRMAARARRRRGLLRQPRHRGVSGRATGRAHAACTWC